MRGAAPLRRGRGSLPLCLALLDGPGTGRVEGGYDFEFLLPRLLSTPRVHVQFWSLTTCGRWEGLKAGAHSREGVHN